MPSRERSGSSQEPPQQSVDQIRAALEAFLADHPRAVAIEDGKLLFDMRTTKYSLATGHERCTLQLWNEERNLVRRVSAAVERGTARDRVLKLTIHRFGQTRPATLELVADRDRRSPSTREVTRQRYVQTLERAMLRAQHPGWGAWKAEGFRTAMDLEKSFGPAYARGSLVQGQQAWAVIGSNAAETPATVDGILSLGVLWLAHCRENAGGRRLYCGLRLVVPRGMGRVTWSRLAWMNADAARWELWEFDETTEDLEPSNLPVGNDPPAGLVRAPNETATRERFAASAAEVLALVPEAMRRCVEQRVQSGTEMAFLLHGLEFARVRMDYAGESFVATELITFGVGANEAALTSENEAELRQLSERLYARRRAGHANAGQPDLKPAGELEQRPYMRPDRRDPLYRMQSGQWLEANLRRDLILLDPQLDAARLYTGYAVLERGRLGLLAIDRDSRMAVIELKAEEDLHLALDGLDDWIRVESRRGELQPNGYFAGMRLADSPPRLLLVAPALRVHPATEVVLRYLSPRVEWELVALGERWRERVKVVWRRRSSDPARL